MASPVFSATLTTVLAFAALTTVSGHTLPLAADTLCVHGDNMEGVQAIREIRALVKGS